MKLRQIASLALSFASATSVALAQAEVPAPVADPKTVLAPLIAVPESENTLSLAECLAIGADRQPAIRAALQSLDASRAGLKSIENIGPIAKAASPDLPFRRQQGERGLIVGEADVQKALQENRYDIIRLYYTFVYARQQDATAADIVEQLDVYYGVAVELSKTPGSKITSFQLYGMEEAINEVRKLRVTARSGQSMALAALKEAMGVEQCMSFLPRDKELPVMGGSVTEEQVICLAKTRRPEMAMAAAGVDAFRLEVCAQAALRVRQRVPTLAAGSDLHSRFIPGPHRNGEYRPGALSPEMPTLLVGPREDRVARAQFYSNRQSSLFDKTRDLVTLESVNAYHLWVAASEKMRQAKARFVKSKDIAQQAKDVAANSPDQEMLIRYQALTGKAQAEYIEAVYEHIKALATLERVTSGGVKPAFPDQ